MGRKEKKASRPCIAFAMRDPKMAYEHLQTGSVPVIQYGSTFDGKPIHTCDDGERTLCRCKLCGGYFLVQDSERRDFSTGNDEYFTDFFPVSGPEDAEMLNRKFDGYQIEFGFPGKYLAQDNTSAPHWTENAEGKKRHENRRL